MGTQHHYHPAQKEMDLRGVRLVKRNVKTVKQNTTQQWAKSTLSGISIPWANVSNKTKQKATSQINSMHFNFLGQHLKQNSQWLSLPPHPSNHDYNDSWSLHGFSYTRQTNGFSYTRQTKLTVGLWMHFSKRNSFYIYICTILYE